mmetsp:Transcript_39056/g.103249  ORF Transcript_39056/g.103249 Transcript_39056/m.103249 type:complete len:447 (+) Transcript_39056:44-1384(+)
MQFQSVYSGFPVVSGGLSQSVILGDGRTAVGAGYYSSSSLPVSMVSVPSYDPRVSSLSYQAYAPSQLSYSQTAGSFVVPAAASEARTVAPPPAQPVSRGEWRLAAVTLSEIVEAFESQVHEQASAFETLSEKEKNFLRGGVLSQRMEFAPRARMLNRKFFNALCAHAQSPSAISGGKPLEVVELPGIEVPRGSYATAGSLLLHMYRDWSNEASHVMEQVYRPLIERLQAQLPPRTGDRPTRILVPGLGLGRLAFELTMAGYEVEGNEASPLFLTVLDWLFNAAPDPLTICPGSHFFQHNLTVAEQYMEARVPGLQPGVNMRGAGRRLRVTAGDFVQAYRGGARGRFDGVVTCFFLDTCDDLVDYVEAIDAAVAPGGVWVNFGPLKYKHNVKLKLAWDELRRGWSNLGYVFGEDRVVRTAYHLPAGRRMNTVEYDALLSHAVKGAKQ